MLEAVSLNTLLAGPRYMGALPLDNGRQWCRADLVALGGLVNDSASLERSAASLGREPTKLAWKAHDTGLRLPREWLGAITKRRLAQPPRLPLQYPFIVKVRGEHSDLLAVNAIVPRGLPSHLRADICQEMMLAIWEERTSIDELRKNHALVNSFVKDARKLNYEGGGFALSLDVPMSDGRSWYDVLPDLSTEVA